MPKYPTKSETESSAESVPVATATSGKAKPAAAQPLPKVKPRYVLVENKTAQTLSLSILDGNGKATELKLAPREASGPLREDYLTDPIRRLAATGKVRIR